MRLITSLTLAAVVVFGSHSPALARTVDCGSAFSGDATLAASCVGDIVVRGGSLNLAGHTLRGTVLCDADYCEIYSDPPNGKVRGSGQPGSVGIRAGTGAADGAGSVAVDNVIVSGFGTGVSAENVLVTNSLVAGNLAYGIDAYVGIESVSSIVSINGGGGLHARMGGVSVVDSQVSENGGNGVRALEGVIATGSTIADNARDGVQNFSAPALLVDSTITGNGGHGVRSDDSDCYPADDFDLVNTTVTGNGVGEDCGDLRACADVVACNPPLLSRGTSCGTSYQMMSGLPGASWQICSLD
jgi:hypothetical protein